MFRVLPGSFVPDEDQGYFFVVVEAPDTASQGVVGELVRKVEKIVAADPAVQDVASVNGFSLLDGSLRNNAARAVRVDETLRGAQGGVAAELCRAARASTGNWPG